MPTERSRLQTRNSSASLKRWLHAQQTPKDYGLKVRTSVEGMLVTAANKMRAGTRLSVGFAGSIVETTVLPADRLTAGANLRALGAFVEELNTANASVSRRPRGNFVWERVPGRLVAGRFFDQIRTATAAYKAHAPTIARYVRNRLHNNELTEWTVALISNPGEPVTIGRHEVGLTKRTLLNNEGAADRLTSDGLYRIRRILSPIDEAMDFTKEEQNELLAASRAAWEEQPGTSTYRTLCTKRSHYPPVKTNLTRPSSHLPTGGTLGSTSRSGKTASGPNNRPSGRVWCQFPCQPRCSCDGVRRESAFHR